MPCTPKQTLLICSTYNSMPELPRGFGDDKETMLAKFIATERQYRKYDERRPNISTKHAAMLICATWLRKYTLGELIPKIADYLVIREDCFFAAAVAETHRDKLKPWAESIPSEFIGLNYEELMK